MDNSGGIKGTKSERKISVELLRTVSMLMIIAYHFSVHSGFSFEASDVSVNRLWVQFLEFGGKTGVNVFILITGYFGINSVRRNNLRILKLWLSAFLYSVTLYLAFVLSGNETFSKLEFIKHILPITFVQWWFATAYFALCLFAPYINKLLKSLSKRDYLALLFIMAFCWCFISTFFTVEIECNNFLWFVFIYSLAGYIRLHGLFNKLTAGKCFAITALLLALTYLSVVVFDVLGVKFAVFSNHATYFFGMKKIPVVMISLFMFLSFLKLNIKKGKFITFVSPAMFGIYLLHDTTAVRVLFWNKIFRAHNYSKNPYLIPLSIAEIAAVFIICMAVELFRINLIERSYSKPLEKFVLWLSLKKEKLIRIKE